MLVTLSGRTISEYVKASQDASDNLDMPTEATNAELNEAITDEWGVKYSKDERKLLKAPYELNGTYSIRKGTKIICDRAFYYCSALRSVVIPDSVTSIGDCAFWGCKSLSSVVIPDGVTSIGDGTFWDCSSLSSVVIPDGVTSIGESAFDGCKSLSSVVIPEGVTSIGICAFSGCKSLESLVLPESVGNIIGNPFSGWNGELKCLSPYFIYDKKVLFDKDKNAIISFRDKDTTSYVIPQYVTSIGNHAFGDCCSLTDIVLSDRITTINEGAFKECI